MYPRPLLCIREHTCSSNTSMNTSNCVIFKLWFSNCVIFFTVSILGENYSIRSFPWRPAHPRGSSPHIPFNSHFLFLLFPSHFLGLTLHLHLCHISSCSLHLSNAGSRRSLSLPRCCLCCRSTVFSCLTCCRAMPGRDCSLSSPKNKDREMPASLKLTVSFPA